MMTCSVIGSRIDYCNSLLLVSSEQNLDTLRNVQNKAARIVCNASRYAPSSDLLYITSTGYPFINELTVFKTASFFLTQ